MRLPIVLAAIALTGASGIATALVLPEAPALSPMVPPIADDGPNMLVLETAPPRAAPAAAASREGGLAVNVVRSIQREFERVDRLPTIILLPDSALVWSETPTPEGMLARGVTPGPMAISAPASSPTVPALPESRTIQARTESPGGPGELAAPETSTSPASTAPQQTGTFEPRATPSGPGPTLIATGGLALGAVAALGVVLYHRIRPHAALENDTRKLIFDAVCGQPGLGVHEISRMARVSYSTATYHLERLVGAGMLVMTPDGNKLCYYKNGGAFSENERRILPLMKNEEAAKLFEAILAAPGTYRAALAEKLGVTATTINWHLRRLREAGLVDETRAGRSAHLYARLDEVRPTLLALASKVEPSEPDIADRLRGYVRGTGAGSTGAGAA